MNDINASERERQIISNRRWNGRRQAVGVVVAAGITGIGLLTGIVYAQKHHAPTGPDAFLHYQVDSTDELVEALRENPQLRRNYAHQFGIPADRIVAFVKNTLVPYRLPQSRWVTDYGVTRSGRIYMVHERLRKGTKVWATRAGFPVLKWACANPLTRVLPGLELASVPRPIHPRPVLPGPVTAPTLSHVASSELPAPTMDEAPLPETPTIDTAAIVPTIPVTGVAASSSMPPLGSPGGGHVGSGPAPYLIPIAIIIGLGTSHGGHPTGPGGGGGTGPAVPEPSSLPLLFVVGVPALIIARRRRQTAS